MPEFWGVFFINAIAALIMMFQLMIFVKKSTMFSFDFFISPFCVVSCLGHTKTSMLRTLNSSGRFSPNEWLLPETRALFEKQAERQKELALGMSSKVISCGIFLESDIHFSSFLQYFEQLLNCFLVFWEWIIHIYWILLNH